MSEQEHLRKVLSSSVFESSELLQRLLAYLAERSLRKPPQPVKEFQIATEVLGRGPEFDPRTDSSVRVSVARLRSKLLEYYATEGEHDRLRIEIPKGSYISLFRDHQEHAAESAAVPRPQLSARKRPDPLPAGDAAASRHRPFGALLAALAAGFALGALVMLWIHPATISLGGADPDPVLQDFWSDFTQPEEKTIAVFSNARFVGNAATGLRYYNPEMHRPEEVKDLHTGVGEVVGVFELSRLFQRLRAPFEIKRAALADWDEVKKANVIFIGGPAENMPVRELRRTARFVFEPYTDSDGRQRMVVVDRHPARGRPARFDAGDTMPIRRDYAIIRILDGFVPTRRILVLAGITTLGTQAAVEFVCRADTLRTLIAQLAEHDAELAPGFECVVEVSINGGVPVDSKVLVTHTPLARSATAGG